MPEVFAGQGRGNATWHFDTGTVADYELKM